MCMSPIASGSPLIFFLALCYWIEICQLQHGLMWINSKKKSFGIFFLLSHYASFLTTINKIWTQSDATDLNSPLLLLISFSLLLISTTASIQWWTDRSWRGKPENKWKAQKIWRSTSDKQWQKNSCFRWKAVHSLTRMWANVQRDCRPAVYRWRPLFNAAKFGRRTLLECPVVTLPRRKTRWNLMGYPKLPNGSQSQPFAILWRHLGEILLFNKFFSDCRYMLHLRRYSPTMLCDGAQMGNFWRFLGPAFPASRVQHISDLHSKFALGSHYV